MCIVLYPYIIVRVSLHKTLHVYIFLNLYDCIMFSVGESENSGTTREKEHGGETSPGPATKGRLNVV